MRQYAQFMAVPKETLLRTPKAFQDYVSEFFDETEIGGKEFFTAFLVFSLRINHWEKLKKGVAPCHSVDLYRFRDGLAKEVGLNEWMRKKEVQKETGISIFRAEWDDGYIEPFVR